MRELEMKASRRAATLRRAAVVAALCAAWAAAEGCGGGGETTTTTSSSSSGGTTSTTASGGAGGAGGATTTTTTTTSTSTGTGGTAPTGCTTAAKGPTRGSAIALTSDESRLVAVNRDAGTVTVMSIDYTDGQPKLATVAEIAVGGEPWQVAIDGCDATAYVVLRKDQKVVEITDLAGAPKKGKEVSVCSEPTSLALTPNNKKLYVSNWVDGTLSVVDPVGMAVVDKVDLNATIAATGKLGTVIARPSLAHPRGLAITNTGDASDDD